MHDWWTPECDKVIDLVRNSEKPLVFRSMGDIWTKICGNNDDGKRNGMKMFRIIHLLSLYGYICLNDTGSGIFRRITIFKI